MHRAAVLGRTCDLEPIHQGMAHVAGEVTAVGVKNPLLKRKNDGKSIDDAGHFFGPALPPGPDLGRDVEEDRDTPLVGLLGHKHVEARVVDQGNHIGPVLIHLGLEQLHHPVMARNAADNLDQPSSREGAHIGQNLHATGAQVISPHANHGHIGLLTAQGLDQGPAMQIAGSFSRHQQDTFGPRFKHDQSGQAAAGPGDRGPRDQCAKGSGRPCFDTAMASDWHPCWW